MFIETGFSSYFSSMTKTIHLKTLFMQFVVNHGERKYSALESALFSLLTIILVMLIGFIVYADDSTSGVSYQAREMESDGL